MLPGPGMAASPAAGARAAAPKAKLSALVDAAADTDVDFPALAKVQEMSEQYAASRGGLPR
eukprot:9313725-Lingulodinium_polyedra.AAC.1